MAGNLTGNKLAVDRRQSRDC